MEPPSDGPRQSFLGPDVVGRDAQKFEKVDNIISLSDVMRGITNFVAEHRQEVMKTVSDTQEAFAGFFEALQRVNMELSGKRRRVKWTDLNLIKQVLVAVRSANGKEFSVVDRLVKELDTYLR